MTGFTTNTGFSPRVLTSRSRQKERPEHRSSSVGLDTVEPDPVHRSGRHPIPAAVPGRDVRDQAIIVATRPTDPGPRPRRTRDIDLGRG